MRLTTRPRSAWCWSFVLEGEGVEPVDVRLRGWRERVEYEVGGEVWRAEARGWCGREFVLLRGRKVEGRAVRPSVLGRRWRVELPEGRYELVPAGALTRAFRVVRRGRDVGRVAPAGAFTRRASVELPDDLGAASRAFLVALVLLAWRRNAAVAAAAGGA